MPLLYSFSVPNNAKIASQTGQESLPFEEAVKKLESIVEQMESGDLPLETLLARFEEGTRLVKVCQAKLEEAELKLQQLEKNATGETTLKSWAPEESDA
jgi:exodeoxyribonuclease VII small subunit